MYPSRKLKRLCFFFLNSKGQIFILRWQKRLSAWKMISMLRLSNNRSTQKKKYLQSHNFGPQKVDKILPLCWLVFWNVKLSLENNPIFLYWKFILQKVVLVAPITAQMYLLVLAPTPPTEKMCQYQDTGEKHFKLDPDSFGIHSLGPGLVRHISWEQEYKFYLPNFYVVHLFQ